MGFISSLVGAHNDYQAQPAILQGGNDTGADDVNKKQTALTDALTAAMNGKGPSLAQQQLQQGTQQNINQGASQIASIKGLNPALAAKMIADNTANANNALSGQAAQLRNQEQLQARGQLGSELNNQRGQDIAQGSSLNNENIQNTLGAARINSGIAAQNTQTNAGIAGGLLGAGGSAINSLGGMMSNGGVVEPHHVALAKAVLALAGGGMIPSPVSAIPEVGAESGATNPVLADANSLADTDEASQGETAITEAPVEKSAIPDDTAKQSAKMVHSSGNSSGNDSGADPGSSYGAGFSLGKGIGNSVNSAFKMLAAKSGGKVPGKANVSGDSKENDVVPTLLSPGEIVVPRSKAKDPEMAKEFIEALKKSKEKKEGGGAGYSKVLKAHGDMQHRLAKLEALCYGGMAK